MAVILTEKEVELWNEVHHMMAFNIIIRINKKNKKAEYIVNGCDINPMPYEEALTYFTNEKR